MRKLINCCFLFYSFSCFAGTANVQKSLNELSKDMAFINRQLLILQNQERNLQLSAQTSSTTDAKQLSSVTGIFDKTYSTVLNQMYSLKMKYESNQYIRISGFDINIALLPSITVKVDFKK